VGRGLVRALGASFDVELATSVDHATARIGERAFDVMLADLRMPDGGGARLVVELAQRSMDVVPRVVLFSGGEPSEADRLVIDRYAVPFLAKPLVVDDLLDVLQRSPPRFS
jgi:DNA-binding NtrC family response regulator